MRPLITTTALLRQSTVAGGLAGINAPVAETAMAFWNLYPDTYSGNCIRVVRQSDSATQDIGFDENGLLDVASIASFCTTNDGKIDRWYDQRDGTTGIDARFTSNQFKIYDGASGRVVTDAEGHVAFELIGSGGPWAQVLNVASGTPASFLACVSSEDAFFPVFGNVTNNRYIGIAESGGTSTAVCNNAGATSVGTHYKNGSSITVANRGDLHTSIADGNVNRYTGVANFTSSANETSLGIYTAVTDPISMTAGFYSGYVIQYSEELTAGEVAEIDAYLADNMPIVYEAPALPNQHRTSILVDATGQANGTGYTTEESYLAASLTYNGNAQITSDKFEFDGTGDYIDLPTDRLYTPGSSFTLFVKNLELDAVNTGTSQTICGVYEADSGEIGWNLTEDAGVLKFNWSTTGASTTNNIDVIPSMAASTIYDVAIVWDGTTLYAFVDGEEAADTEAFTGTFFVAPIRFRMGAASDAGSPINYVDGRFSGIFLTRGEALLDQGVDYLTWDTPLATQTPIYTDTEWANVKLLLTAQDGGKIIDESRYDWPLNIVGQTNVSTTVEPFADANSIDFDGSGDYITLPDHPELEFGSSDLTIETHARFDSVAASQCFAGKYDATGNERSWIFQLESTPELRWVKSSNGTSASDITWSWSPSTDTWYHVAFCRSGSDNRAFVDGTQQGSTATDSTNLFNNGEPLSVGAFDANTNPFNGFHSEMRITVAARYTAGFTAPSGKFPRG